MPSITIGGRPFAEQQRFFRRKISVPTGGWFDLQRSDHAHGFMVAGAFKAELLEDLRGIVQGAIDAGTPIDAFRKQFDEIVSRHGWAYNGGRNWRTRIIYETNIRQSYNAGRWAQLTSPDMQKVRPYLQYRHNDRGISIHPRPLHVSWDGTVLPASDPWWQTHAPMNGWGCKCGVRALSLSDLKALGKAGPDVAPDDGSYRWVDPKGGTHEIPNGIDPGFDYNVGEAARSLPAARAFGQRVMQMPDAWRSRALEDAAMHGADWHADVLPFVDALLADPTRPRGITAAVGMLRNAAVDAIALRQGTPPATALVVISDKDLAHMVRTAKSGRGASSLPLALVRDLPRAMANPDVVLLDTTDGALVYAWRQPDGRYAKVIVRPDYKVKGDLAREPANWMLSGGIVDAFNLEDRRYEVIEGSVQR